MKDKYIERKRYEERAQNLIINKLPNLSDKIPPYLATPYEYYYKQFQKLNKKSKLLEIGSGFGQNTLKLLSMSFEVCATDISSKSVKVMNNKFKKFKNFSSKIVDMEKMPFRAKSFDIVCSAGSLSYGDNELVMKEIYRVLKPGGRMIIVDSLNNNPIYRFNRYLNYLKNKRSISTLKRIPNINLINIYIEKFGYGKVKFFGSISWLFPVLRILFSDKSLKKFSNWIDNKFNVKGSSFKFVLMVKKK